MIEYGKLEGKKVIPATRDEMFEAEATNQRKRVALDEINGVTVSTVFLPFNHAFGDRKPQWFETMIFGSKNKKLEDYQDRYETWEEAEAGHKKAIELVRKENTLQNK